MIYSLYGQTLVQPDLSLVAVQIWYIVFTYKYEYIFSIKLVA